MLAPVFFPSCNFQTVIALITGFDRTKLGMSLVIDTGISLQLECSSAIGACMSLPWLHVLSNLCTRLVLRFGQLLACKILGDQVVRLAGAQGEIVHPMVCLVGST